MIIAMVLAHLVADYVLQWNSLALWKSREYGGVLVHGTIVLFITWLFILPFDPSWWRWALMIGVVHLFIDATPVWLLKRGIQIAALPRFVVDQLLHMLTIGFALTASGILSWETVLPLLAAPFQDYRLWLYLLGYTFLTMPTWVLLQFSVYALVNGSDPDFSQAPNKYLVSLERVLITTFVISGQFFLIPVIALPRLLMKEPQAEAGVLQMVSLAEWLGSLGMAVVIGFVLRLI